jgi:hypothetical protein
MKDKELYERIIKESFWDYNFTVYEIKEICQSNNLKNKKFVFEKILKNSTEILIDITIFTENDIIKLLKEFKPPKFNYDFINRRFKILKRLILKEEVEIMELSWIK